MSLNQTIAEEILWCNNVAEGTLADRVAAGSWYDRFKEAQSERDNRQRKFDHLAVTNPDLDAFKAALRINLHELCTRMGL